MKCVKRWTDELIKKDILNVKECLCIARMPTRSEIDIVTGDTALSNKIGKTKGYYGWAKELNLPIKKCETTLGKKYEKIAGEELIKKGYKVVQMKQNYPFDILVNNYIRIDVKVGLPYCGGGGRWHTYNLYKKYAICDLYIIYALRENKEIEKTLIIPAMNLNVTQLSFGKRSIYNKYQDRWDFIKVFDKTYKIINDAI